MSVTTKFALGAKLKAILIKDVSGRITRISIGDAGIEYELRYFDGVEQISAWFFEDELEQD